MRAESSALFSVCRNYRYVLWRWWDISKPYLMIVGLNPSTADETEDDRTIKRCKRFAKDWGYGGLCMTNLFALRSTDPKIMKKDIAPIGAENNEWLAKTANDAGMILAAWGTDGPHLNRDTAVMKILQAAGQVYCLKLTKHGHPRHPLYVKADTRPIYLIAGD